MKRFLIIMLCLTMASFSCARAEVVLDLGVDSSLSGTSMDMLGKEDAAAADGDDSPEEDAVFSSAIVSSGSYIWRITGETIFCTDIATRQDAASLPVEDLLSPESNPLLTGELFDPEWLILLERDEHGIRVCASVSDDADTLHVMLFDLALADSRISVSAVSDETDTLRQFFDGSKTWMGLDMTGCAAGILIIALDQSGSYNLYCWDIDSKKLTELGTEAFLVFTAAIPRESDVILTGLSLSADNGLDLRVMDLQNGDRSPLETTEIESDPLTLFNYAWNESEQVLYYTVGNTAFRVSPGSGELPVPFAVTDRTPAENRLGILTGGSYVLCAEDGSLIWCDPHAELETTRIRIADASGDENLPDLASGFNESQAAFHATVSVCNDDSVILEHLLNQSDDYDIYVVSSDSGVYSALKNRGYFADVSGNETIRAAAADMPESVRSAISADGRLTGLPIFTQNNTLSLNVKALMDLTGCSREEIPTDWPGMLRLLNQLAEDDILTENPQYTVYDAGFTPSSLKEGLFALILNDCLLWQRQTGASTDEIPSVLLPALREFNAVAWDGFGLPEEEPSGTDWKLTDDERIPLLSVIQAEIAVMDLDGMEYWPLSLNSDSPRLIPETLSVMLINPWSSRTAGDTAFMEYVWENLDILSKMSMSLSMNDPVINAAYDDDIAYLKQLIASYRDRIEKSSSEEEADSLRREMASAEEFLAEYQENAGWLATESSIAEYRTLSTQFVPAVPEFWSADEEDAAVLQFLDGMMPAEQFVTQFTSALKMSILEGE